MYSKAQIQKGFENWQKALNEADKHSYLSPMPFNAKLVTEELIEHIEKGSGSAIRESKRA